MQHTVTDRRTAVYWLALMPAAAGNVLTAAFDAAPTGAAQCRPTGADLRGPFYIPGVPHRKAIASPDEPGTRLIIRGQVRGPDCPTPLANTLLDVWQADASGSYYDDRLCGRLTTDEHGRYELYSILPAPYRVGGRFRPPRVEARAGNRRAVQAVASAARGAVAAGARPSETLLESWTDHRHARRRKTRRAPRLAPRRPGGPAIGLSATYPTGFG